MRRCAQYKIIWNSGIQINHAFQMRKPVMVAREKICLIAYVASRHRIEVRKRVKKKKEQKRFSMSLEIKAQKKTNIKTRKKEGNKDK